MEHRYANELVAVYALDALPAAEVVEFETHLDGCVECQEELGEFHAVASSLVHDVDPPEGVWDRIVGEIDATPGDPNHLAFDELTARRRRRLWSSSTVALTAAAAAIVVFVAISLQPTPRLDESSIVAAAEKAAQQPDALVANFLVDDAPVAQVVLTADGYGYVVPGEDLAALGVDRTYQLWVITDDELVISAGVLGNDPKPAIFIWNGGVSGFALTREVAGGVVSSAGDVVSVVTDL